MVTLDIQKRTKKDKLEDLRTKGLMPAVFYGRKTESTSIAVPLARFLKTWKEAGESTVVTLKDGSLERDALIHDVDMDPVTDMPRHADFYVFEKGQKIELSVPLEFVGLAPAVKELGGILVKVLYELKVEAEPKNLPHNISVDTTSLVDFQSRILAKDISLPAGVTLLEKADEVVALVTQPKEEKEEVAPVDLSTIEVEKKGKKEEEGGGDAGAGATPEAKPEEKKK